MGLFLAYATRQNSGQDENDKKKKKKIMLLERTFKEIILKTLVCTVILQGPISLSLLVLDTSGTTSCHTAFNIGILKKCTLR